MQDHGCCFEEFVNFSSGEIDTTQQQDSVCGLNGAKQQKNKTAIMLWCNENSKNMDKKTETNKQIDKNTLFSNSLIRI